MSTPSNIWSRLEPYARSIGLEGGLHAAIHDPLWLLARQWQLGEFDGEDSGSPVHAHLNMTCTPITRFLPGGIPASWTKNGQIQQNASEQGHLLDAIIPLETWVEREMVRGEPAFQPRLAAEAGLHFLRLLDAYGVGKYKKEILKRFPLKQPDENALKHPLDADTRRFLLVMEDRVPDGGLIYSILQAGNNDEARKSLEEWFKKQTSSDQAMISNVVRDWKNWYQSLFSAPYTANETAWIPERLEYAGLAAAHMPDGEVVLTVPEYSEGHLDWYSFNILPAGSLEAKREDLDELRKKENWQEKISRSAIPMPISFRGMPALRYWELEDARVDFGAMNAGEQQLAKLLLMEFALISGDDWFIIPIMVPVGSLCRTQCLIVRDTFGVHTLVPSTGKVDEKRRESTQGDLPWDLFRLSLDRRPIEGNPRSVPDVLFLPPTLGTSLHGPTLEEVLFLRDEMANMAWALERMVEGPLGQTINRSEAYFRSRQPKKDGVTGDNNQPLVYRLRTEVPEHWIPLIPTRFRKDEDAPPIGLKCHGQWQGRILQPRLDEKGEPIPIHEEEVPREGARVTRTFQYTRWIHGETYLWIGRRKGVGRGEGSSGLRFDVLEPPWKTNS
jgi:hypothetical protein